MLTRNCERRPEIRRILRGMNGLTEVYPSSFNFHASSCALCFIFIFIFIFFSFWGGCGRESSLIFCLVVGVGVGDVVLV